MKTLPSDVFNRQAEIRGYAKIVSFEENSPRKWHRDIQEQLLFLPRTVQGRGAIIERKLRPIVAELDWALQAADVRGIVGG